jgi:hypothetical protein
LLQGKGTRRRYGDCHIDIAIDKLSCENRIPIEMLGGKLVQEFDVLTPDVTQIAKRLDKHREVLTLLFRAACVPEHADPRDLPAWLRLRGERPRLRGGTKKRNELASSHGCPPTKNVVLIQISRSGAAEGEAANVVFGSEAAFGILTLAFNRQ